MSFIWAKLCTVNGKEWRRGRGRVCVEEIEFELQEEKGRCMDALAGRVDNAFPSDVIVFYLDCSRFAFW
jgi:hypothetical protein